MSATAAVHARIEHLAAGLLDAVPAFMSAPGAAEMAKRWAELEAKHRPTLDSFGMAAAIDRGSATICAYERGPESALTHAAVIDTLFAGDRSPLRWCVHRCGIATPQPTMVSGALRYAACLECFEAEHRAQADRLATETTCDVCGADSGIVTPRATQLGSMVVSLFTGACCDDFFSYRTPVSSHTYRRPGRNEPCPCGTGRKYKRCHGAAKAGEHA